MPRCLVIRSGIVWVEYNNIISSLPKLASKEEYKERAFQDWMARITSTTRPDDWVSPALSHHVHADFDRQQQHSRSHPSHYLTTRHAPPRLFPFPLGKTKADATVADELWWEGGNAPHVVSPAFVPGSCSFRIAT